MHFTNARIARIAAESPLGAVITVESLDELGSKAGDGVMLYLKAVQRIGSEDGFK